MELLNLKFPYFNYRPFPQQICLDIELVVLEMASHLTGFGSIDSILYLYLNPEGGSITKVSHK